MATFMTSAFKPIVDYFDITINEAYRVIHNSDKKPAPKHNKSFRNQTNKNSFFHTLAKQRQMTSPNGRDFIPVDGLKDHYLNISHKTSRYWVDYRDEK